jgi:hypothetical protein
VVSVSRPSGDAQGTVARHVGDELRVSTSARDREQSNSTTSDTASRWIALEECDPTSIR